jgi:hypothetical protein
MPSSLVFAALALAWIVVLVPMVARRRQEVRRTADSALAARVLRRGDAAVARARPEEVPAMPAKPDHDDAYRAYDPPPRDRHYRPGRGGYDPHAAELAARAKYGFRQRVVLFLLLAALATGLIAGLALPVCWWAHGGVDALLVAYLAYLRRQVRIEQEIRRRRLERARTRRAIESRRPAEAHDAGPEAADYDGGGSGGFDSGPAHTGQDGDTGYADDPDPEPPVPRLPARPPTPPGATIVELDDEDPALHELAGEGTTPYRRAAGE